MPAVRARILTPDNPEEATYYADGYLEWDDFGRIVDIGPYRNQSVDEDLHPKLLVPGFVDGHLHYPQTRIVGSASGPLLPWLRQSVFPEEARFAEAQHAQTVAALFTQKLARAGTTLSMAYGSSHPEATDTLLQAADRAGIRMIAGPVLMDTDCPEELQVQPAEAIAGIRALAQRWDGHDQGRLAVAVIPRFALSCTPTMLTAAGQLARELNLWITTHLSENQDECRIACERFKAADYLEVYERYGLLTERSVYAHCIHLSAGEIERFASAGARIAHCPDSNFFLGSGQMPIQTIIDHGISFCIGSDIAAGRSFSIPKNASAVYDNALLSGTEVTPQQLLWWSTCGGAQTLGHDNLGRLTPTFEADMALFAPPPWVRDKAATLAWLLLNRDLPDARRLWVRGREVDLSD
jgi:guanine deaminase